MIKHPQKIFPSCDIFRGVVACLVLLGIVKDVLSIVTLWELLIFKQRLLFQLHQTSVMSNWKPQNLDHNPNTFFPLFCLYSLLLCLTHPKLPLYLYFLFGYRKDFFGETVKKCGYPPPRLLRITSFTRGQNVSTLRVQGYKILPF